MQGQRSKKNFWGNTLLAEHEQAFELLCLFFFPGLHLL